MRVYNQNLPGNYGPLERTRPYWQWLLQRRAFDQLYVALDGPNLWDLDESTTQSSATRRSRARPSWN